MAECGLGCRRMGGHGASARPNLVGGRVGSEQGWEDFFSRRGAEAQRNFSLAPLGLCVRGRRATLRSLKAQNCRNKPENSRRLSERGTGVVLGSPRRGESALRCDTASRLRDAAVSLGEDGRAQEAPERAHPRTSHLLFASAVSGEAVGNQRSADSRQPLAISYRRSARACCAWEGGAKVGKWEAAKGRRRWGAVGRDGTS